MIVFLIGYMGSGKTSIGKQLAKRTGYRHLDTDKQIEESNGKTVAEIFEDKGEAFFRAEERKVLENLPGNQENIIVSTGGGLPCFSDNMELMNSLGLTVYIKMGPEKLVKRLRNGKEKRPIIRGKSDQELLEFIESALVKRSPYYEQASVIVDADHASDAWVQKYIYECIGYAAKQNSE